MTFSFSSEIIEWRGPAPFLYVPVPPDLSAEIKAISSMVTYGWGVIPAVVTIGSTEYKTSLFPRDGIYLVGVKVAVQRAECVGLGDIVAVRMEVIPAAKR